MYNFKENAGESSNAKFLSQPPFTRHETREFYWRNFELVHLKVNELIWPDYVKTEDDAAAYLEKQARSTLETELPDRYDDNEHEIAIQNILDWGNGFLDKVSFLQIAVAINHEQGNKLIGTERDVKADSLDSELTKPTFTLV